MSRPSLIINPGSTSRKYAVALDGQIILRASFEKVGDGASVTLLAGGSSEERIYDSHRFDGTTDYVITEAADRGLLTPDNPLGAVGLRIVAPGTYFQANKLIDAGYIARLEAAAKDAPLHIRPELHELAHVRELMKDVPVYGISDSAFHAGLPDVTRRYAIPAADAEAFGIYRFGFHGISLASIVHRLPEVLGTLPPRLVVCHLGGGASVTALKDGQSVDTSMGFSPLEGLIMATRVGDIDPGALIHLAKAKGLSLTQLEHYLNTASGLRGLSGKTGDMREVIEGAEGGDAACALALDAFVYRIRKYVGAYAAILGGLDALVFSATIGERSSVIRSRVVAGLSGLGMELDSAANDVLHGQDGVITKPRSAPQAVVVATDELAAMARQTRELHGS